MLRTALPLLLISACWLTTARAQPPGISPECEAELALSAAPDHLQDGASVYVLGDKGYELQRRGENPFTCIVQHTPANSLIPMCFDAVGTEAIVPAILREGELLAAGRSPDEARNEVRADVHAGHFAPAGRAGVAYMVSNYTLRYIEQAKGVQRIPPHVMFYAPGVSGEDIGASFAAASDNPGLPFIVDEGPHGYMIVWTQRGSDGSRVIASCGDSVPQPGDVPVFGS